MYVVRSDDTGLVLRVGLRFRQDSFSCVLQNAETGMGVRVDETQVVVTILSKYQQRFIWSEYVQIERNQQQRLLGHA